MSIRRTLIACVLATLVGLYPSSARATSAGTVAPDLETSIIQLLETCYLNEVSALSDLESFGDKDKVTGSLAASAAGKLNTAASCIDGILGMVLSLDPSDLDPKTQNALKNLEKNLKDAFKADGKAVKKIARSSKAKGIRKEINKALDAKQAAKSNLQGVKAKRKDGPTNIPPDRFMVMGEPFFGNLYNANATAKYASKPTNNAGWKEFNDNGKFKRKRVKLPSGEKINIWEFRARKRDLASAIDFDLNRSFGPPTYFFGTVGTYVTKDKDIAELTGQAKVCYSAVRDNVNITHMFYSVCVVPNETGLTLERFTENGSAGSVLFPGVHQVDVLTAFNTSHFITWAGPRGGHMMEIGATPAGWPYPWEHLRANLQSFGFFGKSKLGLEGLGIFHTTR